MDFNDRRGARFTAKKAGAEKVPVCRGCGEAFDSRESAVENHGKMGCGTETGERGYQMTKYDEAF